MTETHRRAMLQAWHDYEMRDPPTVDMRHSLVWMPLGTRLLRLMRTKHGWQAWTATNDYIYGTYFMLFDDGRIERVTIREDEGDEIITIRPSDEDIRRQL